MKIILGYLDGHDTSLTSPPRAKDKMILKRCQGFSDPSSPGGTPSEKRDSRAVGSHRGRIIARRTGAQSHKCIEHVPDLSFFLEEASLMRWNTKKSGRMLHVAICFLCDFMRENHAGRGLLLLSRLCFGQRTSGREDAIP